MCSGCLSNVDAAMLGAGSALVTAKGAWLRLTRPATGAAVRRARRWDDDAVLMRRLGHDPVVVLGPRPDVPVTDASPAPLGRAQAPSIR